MKLYLREIKIFANRSFLLVFCCRLDNKSHGRASMSSDLKVGPESDTDSMAEYGEGDTGK